MIKKMTAFVVIFIMVAAMWIIPSNASTFNDSLFFNADFNSESFNDTVGNVEGVEWYNDENAVNEKGEKGRVTSSKTPAKSEFKNDAEIGRKVLSFKGDSIVFYDKFDNDKLQSNFTLEVYVKLPKSNPTPSGWGVIAGNYWNANPNRGIGITYGQHALAKVGANRKFSVVQGDDKESFTTFTGARADGTWIHLVYTHDGVNESYYENGKLVATQAVQQTKIPYEKTETVGFRIGGYNMVSQFCANMDCAYVRTYSSAATASDVTALYEGRNEDAAKPSAGNNNSSSSGSNNSSNKTNNASTFDLGIVSLAAVTLSSAVVAKKRRR